MHVRLRRHLPLGMDTAAGRDLARLVRVRARARARVRTRARARVRVRVRVEVGT